MAKVETATAPWTTGSTETRVESFQEQYKAHMAKLGAKGGKVSGAKRMTNLSAEQRREIATNAAKERWKKNRRK